MAFPKAFLSELDDLVKPVLCPRQWRHVTLCPPPGTGLVFLATLIVKAITIDAMAHPTPILHGEKKNHKWTRKQVSKLQP